LSAEEPPKALSEDVADLLYGESFVSSSTGGATGDPGTFLGGNLLDLIGANEAVGSTTDFRPGTFKGASTTAGQVVRRSTLSGLAGTDLAFRMSSIEGSLVPFAFYGESEGLGFSMQNASQPGLHGIAASLLPQFAPSGFAGPAIPRQTGLSFNHGVSSSDAPGFDSSRGLQSRQLELAGEKFSVGFSRLNVGQVDSPDLLKDVTDSVNKNFTTRSALGAANNTPINLKDVQSLKGVQQRDGYLSLKPLGALSLATEFNNIETPDGNVDLQDYRFNFGKFSVTGTQRDLDRSLSDTVLKGMGRDDLVALKGTESREWTALLPLFADEKGNSRISFTHFRKDEVVDKSGDIATATESHTRKNSVVMKPLTSSTLEFVNEVADSGNVQRADGLDLNQTLTRTYKWTQQFADHTTTTFSRNFTLTDMADDTQEDVRSEALSLHLDTKPWRDLNLVGDWNRIDNSRDGETAEAKLKVTAPINKSLMFSSDFQDKYTDLNGIEDKQSYTLSYLWNEKNKISVTTKVDQIGKTDSLKTTYSNTFSVAAGTDTTLEYTLSDTEDIAAPAFSQKFTIRQKVFDHLAVVARQDNYWTTERGDESVQTYYFDWSKEKSPYSLQVGFESLDFNKQSDEQADGEEATVREDKPALYLKLAATPIGSLSIGGSYSRRSDLEETLLELWDWSLTKSFGSKWSLSAKEFCNKPSVDMLTDSVLPFSKTYEKKYERDYSLGFPVSDLPMIDGSYSGSIGYTKKEDYGAATISGEVFFALTKNVATGNKMSMKVSRGTGISEGDIENYFTYLLSYGVDIGNTNEFSVDARYTDDDVFSPVEEGKVKVDLTFRRVF